MIDFHERTHEGRSASGAFIESQLHVLSQSIFKDLSEEKENKYYLGCHLIDLWDSRAYAVYYDTWKVGREYMLSVRFMGNCDSTIFFAYCMDTFGLEKSQVSRYMNIVSEFGDGAKGFKKDFAGFQYSQLSEMLPLTPEQRKNVSPDWTIKRIREYKKSLSDPVATSQRKENDLNTFAYRISPSYCSPHSKAMLCSKTYANDDLIVNTCLPMVESMISSFSLSDYSVKDKANIVRSLLAFACDTLVKIGSYRSPSSIFGLLNRFGYIYSEDKDE